MRSRDQLFSFQKRAVDFIKEHQSCAIWADMGLGKTAATMTAIVDLLDAFESRRTLVVAPLRVARKVWTDEAAQWQHLNHLTFSKIIGSRPTRRTSLYQKGEIHLINRENLKWLVDSFFDMAGRAKRYWPYDTVVLDESQSFMNQSTARWKAIRRVRPLFPRMIQLTGTPAPKGYMALWSQLFLLDRGERLGRTQAAFHDRWFRPMRGDGYTTWQIKETAPKEIQAAVSDLVLSLRAEDYFDLPPVIYNPVRVQMRIHDQGTYNKLERKYVAELIGGGKVTAANAAVCSMKLLQLAAGFLYTGVEDGAFQEFHREKILALLEILDGASGPVMIAHNFRADRERIVGALKKFCTPTQRWAVADSDADLEAFAKGVIDFLVIHPATAGHGLNLHTSGSETIVWFSLGSNLEHYQQLNARLIGGVRRIGKSVTIHHILTDRTIDLRWFEILKNKSACQDDLTRAMANRVKEMKL